jgi:hypothetical protein
VYNYSLYISIAGELSEKADLYNLAKSATYFEVEPDDARYLGEELIDEMPVPRKIWEEVFIKNHPLAYKSDSSNKNKLYDLILDNPTTTTFFIKSVYGSQTVYGYFGEVDCDINEDRSLVTIKPTVVDQYTDFIENYEEEVDIFGGKNLIRNGDFEVWTGGDPDYWSGSNYNQETLLDKDCAKMGDYSFVVGPPDHYILLSSLLRQKFSIAKDQSALFSFFYALSGDVSYRYNLKFVITLKESEISTPVYYLHADGSWGSAASITFKNNASPIPISSITDFTYYSIVADITPIAGILTVEFQFDETTSHSYGTTDEKPYLYVQGVSFIASEMSYIDLSVSLPSENIKYKTQIEIMVNSGGESVLVDDKFLYSKIKRASSDPLYPDLEDYFDSGAPNSAILDNGKTRLHDDRDFSYSDWQEEFDDKNQGQDKYGWEMCELTVFQGNYYTQWFKTYRNYYGYAIYAREEYLKEDEYDGDDLIPPEADSGWVSFDKDASSGKRLWIRKPFNGAEYSWTQDTKTGSGTDSITGLNYHDSLHSKKDYPIGSSSVSITTGIDFRDICRNIYRSTHQSRAGKEVYSMFFWNDSPYSDFFDIESGLNYYNMKQNFLNYIAAIHTSAIKQISDSSYSSSELKMSFKKLFDDMLIKFPQIIWFIDQDLNLHFEHIRFLHRIREYVDIRDLGYINEYKSYQFDTSKLYGNITREDVNSYYKDFKKSEEKFKRITTNKRRKDNRKELATTIISADITGALENPSDLNNGIVLVAYFINGSGDNEILYGPGQITGNSVPNGVMATSYLLKEFGRYIGTWHEGIIDSENVTYNFSQYCKLGVDIKLKGIISENYLFTDIGVALIKEKKYDYENEETICTPIYMHIDFYQVADTDDFIEMEVSYADVLT